MSSETQKSCCVLETKEMGHMNVMRDPRLNPTAHPKEF